MGMTAKGIVATVLDFLGGTLEDSFRAYEAEAFLTRIAF
jgi:hypothetical protein